MSWVLLVPAVPARLPTMCRHACMHAPLSIPADSTCMLDAARAPQATEEELQAGGAGGGAAGKSRKGQGRWLSRWLARDGSSRKQGKEKGSSKRSEDKAVQPKPESKPAGHLRPHARSSGPGESASPSHRCSCLLCSAVLYVLAPFVYL